MLDTLLARRPGESKTAAIENAIRGYLAADATERLQAMAGTLELEDVSSELRSRDRRT